MKIIIQFQRIEPGLCHAFAGGHHIGMVARRDGGWFFRSNTGFLSSVQPSRINAVMVWPAISEYQLSKAGPATARALAEHSEARA